MMFIDWCLIDALFVSECWAQLYARFHLTKLGKNFHRKDDGESPDLGEWALKPWSWNPLPEEIRWTMWEREKPTEEKFGQELTSQFCEARPARQAWTSCTCRDCIQHAQLFWWIKPDCPNCCYKGLNSAGTLDHWSFPSPSTQRRAQVLACQNLPSLWVNGVCLDCIFWAFTAIVNWTGVMHIYLL